ncbi:hypothetical protein WICPIJ_000345 [Wickerhamomyces pijperi]|uniref:Bms1-type G domain-containing protein n=1 Tax=Wickerhamomyces pijperi TaxID=599730 RepID=A0A9P8TS49_WICPI|nr:hypothetical protein WICPIJ_000345 [Wickerhamomyces pijperi]
MDSKQSNKSHHGGSTKTPAKKKLHTQGHNAKAFAVNAPMKLQRQAMRSSDVNEKKLHVPMVDRTPDDDPPPVIVAVVGPPGTGKTTLIKSLVKQLAKQSLTEVKGPITVVSGKRRRLTFIEVANDLNSMIDAAKIADLVLLIMDGNFGLEMETMEFLNIAQHHGMPRVLAVATHLDLFKSASTLRASKKRLKQRLWTEVYQGAKLFYLSGVMNGRYPDREILNLTRFISVMKFRPLKWRNEHPYLLVDRLTDLTHPTLIEKNKKCDRKLAMYGYLHGTPLAAENARIHIAGVGDYTVSSVEKLPDPCPTPYFEQKMDELERLRAEEAAKSGEVLARTTPRRRKRLEDKQKIIYAPMSDVGGLLVDKDTVYIEVGHTQAFVPGQEKGLGEQLVTGLQGVGKSLDEQFKEGEGLQLFSNSEKLKEVHEDENEESEEDDDDEEEQEQVNTGRSSMRRPRLYQSQTADSDLPDINSDDEEDENAEGEYHPKTVEIDFHSNPNKEDLDLATDSEFELSDSEEFGQGKNLRGAFGKRRWDISKLIYMNNITPESALARWRGEEDEEDEQEENIEDDEDEDFFTKKGNGITVGSTEAGKQKVNEDTFIPVMKTTEELELKWNVEKLGQLAVKFLGSATKILKEGDDDEEELYGDFEDLEAEGKDSKGSESNENDQDGDDFTNFDKEEEKDELLGETNGDGSDDEEVFDPTLSLEERRSLNAKKKEKLRLQFEAEEGESMDAKNEDAMTEEETWYEMQKAKMAKQLEINRVEFSQMDANDRLRIEGYKAGSYVRIVFDNIPPELIENFKPEFPLVLGGLLPSEERFGFMNVRIRRHRWHKKILKSNDPLILSLGWRRFQTLPIYTTSDSRTRTRMLKYTPEHTFCNASFYGPLVAPNTTFCGMQVVSAEQTTGAFRIAATGIVEEVDSSVEIVKKLKLVGHPYKIFRNTAFIKDMFSSALEVAKFEGAQIKTVSGIRGEIKRALSKPEGHFRATFEDKIILSDIVIMRTWYPVQAKRFYNPVTSHLLSDQSNWKGMRLTGAIRAAQGIELENKRDSVYGKVERQERHFNGLKVPKAIRSELPFKTQMVQQAPAKSKTYLQKRAVVLKGDEKKARATMHELHTIAKAKDEKRKETKITKRKEMLKKLAKEAEIRGEKEKERKKEFFAKEGRKRSGGDSAAGEAKRRK